MRTNCEFVFISFVCLTFFAASSAATPLYQVYQHQLGFSSATLAVIFGCYAAGMVTSLLTIGSLSDYLGRKPVLATAIFFQVLSMIAFLKADDVQSLLIARFAQGVATGMATAVMGAYLFDLNSRLAYAANSVVPLSGVGIGVVASSLLVDFTNNPLHTVFFLLIILFAIQIFCIPFVRETTARRPGVLRSMRPMLGVPGPAKKMFLLLMPMNTAVWALNGMFLSLAPGLVRAATFSSSALTSGVVISLFSFCAAAAVGYLRAKTLDFLMKMTFVLLNLGVVAILIATYTGWVPLFFLATVSAGVGAGSFWISSSKSLHSLAPASERATLIAAYYVVSQIAFVVPSILVGMLVRFIGLPLATYVFGAFLLVLLVISKYFQRRGGYIAEVAPG